MHQDYLKSFIIFLIIFAIPICGNWLFLLNCGELLPIEEIVNFQLASDKNCIVGLATRYQPYYYKEEMYRQKKAEVLILGSSRVMQIKEEFFSSPMLNAGGAMRSIQDGFSFVKKVFDYQKPKVVMIGIDFWWFNKNVDKPATQIKPPLQTSHRISFRSYLLPYKWLWQKKITLRQYVEKLNPYIFFKKRFKDGIGVDGILNKNGFGQDGSYFYTKVVSGKEVSIDEKFQYSLDLIQQNVDRFEKNAYVDPTHFNNFLKMIDFIKKHNVKVILFMPPLAPSVIKEMKEFSILKDLQQNLSQANLNYYDFHDPQLLKSTDCEFVDGTHGGDITFAKMLEVIAQQDNFFAHLLNTEYLHAISNFNQLAMIPRNDLTRLPEIDFLKIGCQKSDQYQKALALPSTSFSTTQL